MCSSIHENNKSEITWCIASLLVYICGILGAGLQSGSRDTEEAEDANLENARWIFFIIWPAIYINQFVWHLYFIYTQLKKPQGESRSYLMYSTQTTKGILFFMFFIIANLLAFIWWVCIYLSSFIGAAIIILFFCLAIIATNVMPHKFFYEMRKDRNLKIPSRNMYIILFLNGIQLFATWLTLANMVSWSGIFVAYDIATDEQAAIIFEIVLIVILFVYLYLDLFRFKEYLRYTYITYIVVILSSIAILSQVGFNFDLTSQIMILLICIFTFIMLIVKIVFIGCKSKESIEAPPKDENEPNFEMNATQI